MSWGQWLSHPCALALSPDPGVLTGLGGERQPHRPRQMFSSSELGIALPPGTGQGAGLERVKRSARLGFECEMQPGKGQKG